MLAAAALLGATGVILGAFGAHGLEARVGAQGAAAWETAVRYHLIHALALLAVSGRARAPGAAAVLWTLGTVLFSGSIYLLVLGGPRALGPVTPLGGVCLIAGWLALLLRLRAP